MPKSEQTYQCAVTEVTPHHTNGQPTGVDHVVIDAGAGVRLVLECRGRHGYKVGQRVTLVLRPTETVKG